MVLHRARSVTNLRSPALSKCGCVSWSGCPKLRSEAEVDAQLAWEVGALVLVNEESSGLAKGLLRVIDLDTRFKTGRLYFILGIYTALGVGASASDFSDLYLLTNMPLTATFEPHELVVRIVTLTTQLLCIQKQMYSGTILDSRRQPISRI